MAVAGGVADDAGVEFLEGSVPCHRARDDVGVGAFAVEGDLVTGDGGLRAVGHQPLADDEPRARRQFRGGHAVGGVHALDLHHFHFHRAVFGQRGLGDGIQNALAAAVAGAVMFFDVFDLRALFEEKAVDAVVLGVLRAAVVDAAARDDDDVSAFADVEVVVNGFLDAALAQHHRNMHAFVFRAGLYENIDARAVFFRLYVDVGGGAAPRQLAVRAEIVSAHRHVVKARDLGNQPFLHRVHFQHGYSSPISLIFPQGRTAYCVPVISFRTSFAAPCFSMRPSTSTTISSAMERMRS